MLHSGQAPDLLKCPWAKKHTEITVRSNSDSDSCIFSDSLDAKGVSDSVTGNRNKTYKKKTITVLQFCVIRKKRRVSKQTFFLCVLVLCFSLLYLRRFKITLISGKSLKQDQPYRFTQYVWVRIATYFPKNILHTHISLPFNDFFDGKMLLKCASNKMTNKQTRPTLPLWFC